MYIIERECLENGNTNLPNPKIIYMFGKLG